MPKSHELVSQVEQAGAPAYLQDLVRAYVKDEVPVVGRYDPSGKKLALFFTDSQGRAKGVNVLEPDARIFHAEKKVIEPIRLEHIVWEPEQLGDDKKLAGIPEGDRLPFRVQVAQVKSHSLPFDGQREDFSL